MQEQSSADDDTESVASGSAPAGGSAPARRRPRRPSLLTAVAAARPLSLLNLRLSLMDRDFTEQDFDLLVRLDELEAGGPGGVVLLLGCRAAAGLCRAAAGLPFFGSGPLAGDGRCCGRGWAGAGWPRLPIR